LSKIFIGVPRPSASSYRQQTSRLQSKPFLRKATAYFARESRLDTPLSSDIEHLATATLFSFVIDDKRIFGVIGDEPNPLDQTLRNQAHSFALQVARARAWVD
jgi:hypothetical protein